MALTRAAALLVRLNMIGTGTGIDAQMDILRRNVAELSQTPEADGIEVTRRPALREYHLHDRDADDLKPWD